MRRHCYRCYIGATIYRCLHFLEMSCILMFSLMLFLVFWPRSKYDAGCTYLNAISAVFFHNTFQPLLLLMKFVLQIQPLSCFQVFEVFDVSTGSVQIITYLKKYCIYCNYFANLRNIYEWYTWILYQVDPSYLLFQRCICFLNTK